MAGIAQIILGFLQQQEQNRLAREKWDIEKDEATTKMKQQKVIMEGIEKSIASGLLTREQASDILLNPKGIGATLHSLAQWSTQKQQEPPPLSFEQTGEALRSTDSMIKAQPQQGLPQQIAQGQLGFNPQNIAKDVLFKEFGIGHSTEPVKSDLKIKLPDGKYVYAQILRNGQVIPTQQEVPPEWKETQIDTQGGRFNVLRNMVTGAIDWQSANPVATEVTREKTIGGPTGVQNVPIPKLVMPGQPLPPGLPEPVKHEPLTMTGPRGEQETVYINPITGEPLKAQGPSGPPGVGPVSGIQTKPAQPQSVPQSQQISMMQSGMESLSKIKDAIFDPKTGKINRTNLANAMIKMPRTEGKRVGDLIGAALNAIRLASTGAAFSQEELNQLKAQYIPSYLAKDEQIYDQWDMLTKFVNGMLQQLDPNAVFTKKQQEEFQKLSNVPKYKGGVNLQPGPKGKSIVRTGTDKATGKKVVEYSDGTIEYGK